VKKWSLGLAVLFVAVLVWFALTRRTVPETRALPAASPEAALQSPRSQSEPETATTDGAALAPAPSAVEAGAQQTVVPVHPSKPTVEAFTNIPPATVMESVRQAFRDYASRFGGNPVGTNEEITRALNGDNPRQVNFLNEQAGVRINEKGELVDPWGVPFFLHQLAAREMEIRSAGPDRAMWTDDDLVIK
jgi:hypothetical protein